MLQIRYEQNEIISQIYLCVFLQSFAFLFQFVFAATSATVGE